MANWNRYAAQISKLLCVSKKNSSLQPGDGNFHSLLVLESQLINPKIKALIFDMDGVLVDTEPIHIKAFQIFMDDLNLDYEPEYIHSFVGYSIDQNVRKINQDYLNGREIPVDEGVKRRDQIFISLLKDSLREPLSGIMELFHFCTANNIITALASSSWQDQVELILDILKQNGYDIRPQLASIVHGDHVEQRKPAPDIYLRTLRNLGFPASSCWAIEDSGAGVQSAKAAEIQVIGLSSPFNTPQQLQPADKIVDSLPEATAFLKDLL